MIKNILRAMRAPVYTVSIAHPLSEEISEALDEALDGMVSKQLDQAVEDCVQSLVVTTYMCLSRLGAKPRRLLGDIKRGSVETRCIVRLDDDEAAMKLSEGLRAMSCEETRVLVTPGNTVLSREPR